MTRGDVVLVLYPFTDLNGSKLRPAVVVSADAVHNVTAGRCGLRPDHVRAESLDRYLVSSAY